MSVWMILDIFIAKTRRQQSVFVSIPGVCSATVVGLVVITPAAGYVQPGYALLMGSLGGFFIYLFLSGKKRFFHVDDTLDVFSCHALGGILGTLLTGLFSQTSVNGNGQDGAFYGRPIQLWYQLVGVVVVSAYSAVCTAAILLPMHFTVGIRINRLEQVRGLDNVAHGVIEQDAITKLPPTVKISSIAKKKENPHYIPTIQLETWKTLSVINRLSFSEYRLNSPIKISLSHTCSPCLVRSIHVLSYRGYRSILLNEKLLVELIALKST